MDERLNDAIPEGTLIKMLAKEKRDLQLENLELKRMVAVLREDNESLKNYATGVAGGTSCKEINKTLNIMNNLWSQIAKKVEPMKELCAKTDEFKGILQEFVKHLEMGVCQGES